MIAYQYDLAGLYQGETITDESPLEPGVYLLPARCTVVAPPQEFPSDRWPRWNGVSWDLVNRPSLRKSIVEQDPVSKLQEFLNANPDVAALLT